MACILWDNVHKISNFFFQQNIHVQTQHLHFYGYLTFFFVEIHIFFFDRVTFQPPWSFLFVLLFFTRLTLQVYFDLI